MPHSTILSPNCLVINMKHILTSLILSVIFLLPSLHSHAAAVGSSSVLANGRWVKIHVDSTAIYRLDYATLRQWGFTDPARVTVHGYGSVEQAHILDTAPDDLPQVPAVAIGDALYFYGEGDRRLSVENENSFSYIENYYSNGSNYFLTDAPFTPMTPAQATPLEAPEYTSTHTHIDLRTPRTFSVNSSSVYFFSRNLAHIPEKFTCRFDVTDFAAKGNVAYRYIFQHSQLTQLFMQMDFSGDVKPGSYTLGGVNRNIEDNLLYSRSVMKKISVTPTSDTGFAMSFGPRAGSNFNLLAVAEVSFMYDRYNYLRGSQRHFRYYPSGEVAVKIPESDPGLRVWDVTAPRSPREGVISRDDDGAALISLQTLSPESSTTLCAFIPGKGIPEPGFVGEVSCRNLHAASGIDYLIVTTEALRDEAERLAEGHRSMQGLNVLVVTQDEVFNEFSSGSAHPNGLRKFVKMLSAQSPRPLRHLLLFGAATYDPKGYQVNDGREYLVGYEMERVDLSRYNSLDFNGDAYFALTADRINPNPVDDAGKMTVSVGRAPILDLAEAAVFVDNSLEYLSDPALSGRFDSAIITSCAGEEDTHLNSALTMASDILASSPTATVAHINSSLYPADLISGALRDAAAANPRYVCYTGHSTPYRIGTVLNAPECSYLRFGSRPVFYMAACCTAPVQTSNRGIATRLLLMPGGPIAVIASGHECYITNNHILNEAFVRHFFSPSASTNTLGDAWLEALNSTGTNETQRVNNFCYNFLGDPALPLRKPDRGVALSQDAPMSLVPLAPNTVEGVVTLPDGSVDTDFNGTLTLSLYDAPFDMPRIDAIPAGASPTVTTDDVLLCETAVEVSAGRWRAEIIPPLPQRQGLHRLSLSAYALNGSIALGGVADLPFASSSEPPLDDTTPPHIELTIGDGLAPHGSSTGPAPLLTAHISDSGSGLSKNYSAVGAGIRLMIDGKTSLTPHASRLLKFEADGSATLSMYLPMLLDGRHEVTLTAVDLAGNSATESQSFVVVTNPIEATLQADSTLVRDCVTFSLLYDMAVRTENRLVIRDKLGNTVYTADNVTFPYAYDLTDSHGKPLPDGRYRASALLRSHPRYGSTPEITFTVAAPLR